MRTREQQKILNEKAHRNFAAFILACHDDYLMGWFHREVCKALMQFYVDLKNGKKPRLILTAPPRHGKSQLISRDFPAWLFGIDPNLSIIAASYSSDLAVRMNKDVQRIMDGTQYADIFPDSILSKKRNAGGYASSAIRTMSLFEIPFKKGSLRSVGVGNGITGMGCDVLIIDDPFKDRKDADSPTMRRNVWDWYTSTARTRLAPNGGIIVMHTRWHEDDLAGRLIEKGKSGDGENFVVINYPAIAEHDEKYRKIGEALHTERYPIDELVRIKQTIGERDFAALYQQRPTPQTGGIFKKEWFKYWDWSDLREAKNRMTMHISSWDLTFEGGENNDFVCGGTMFKAGADIFVTDLDWSHYDFPQQIRAIKNLNERQKPSFTLIEAKANGSAAIATLKREISGIIPIKPTESKVQRANAIAPYVEAGNIWLPNPKYFPWVNRFVDELCTFPSAAHDDAVDFLTQGVNYLMQKNINLNAWR